MDDINGDAASPLLPEAEGTPGLGPPARGAAGPVENSPPGPAAARFGAATTPESDGDQADTARAWQGGAPVGLIPPVEPTSISLAAASDFVLRLAYRLCGPEGADDVHQETFRRLCQSGKVNHGMVECNLSQLSRITRNAFLDILKVGNTKKRGGDRVTISLDAEDIELPSAGATPESLVVQAAQVRDLRRAIHHLRPDQQIIVKCLLEGKSIADIAREMEIPASTINSRLRAAEAVLRVALYGTAAGERYE